MNYRHALLIPIFLLLAAPWAARSQAAGAMGIFAPQLSCTLSIDADSLFYVANDYLPNTLNVTITVTNNGDEAVGNINANLVKNPRFVIGGDGFNPKAVSPDTLGPGETGNATFILRVASASSKNALDTVSVTITSNRGYTQCMDVVWLQRETRANVECTFIDKLFNEIVFDDQANAYDPDTAQLRLTYTNIGTDVLHDAVITRILNPGVSSDDTDPFRNVGGIPAGLGGDVIFGIVPKNRENDTTTTICFQIQGRTGYKDYQTGEIPLWQDTCCVDVFIPKSRQPKYELTCDITPDVVLYKDHKYDPPQVTFSLTVKNIGTADGFHPTARISLPPGLVPATAADGQDKKVADLLAIGQTTSTFTWTYVPRPSKVWDTLCIVATVVDTFGYSASTECCFILDSIRQAQFQVSCASTVDSVVVDTVIGAYINGTFDVMFNVCNTGTDFADSVNATVSIQSPDLEIVSTFTNIKPLWREIGHTLTTGLDPGEREDTLSSGWCWTFVWPLRAIPRGVSGDICMTFTIEAPNADEVTCELCVYVPRLDPPDLVQQCYTNPGYDPPDTLHISAQTGGYEPEKIQFCTTIKNDGGGTAKNVIAYFSAPQGMLLAPIPGNVPSKPAIPAGSSVNDIGPNDSVVICWEVIPLARPNDGAWIEFRVDLTSDSQDGIAPSVCGVFVPRRPVTTAISISRDNVTYYGAPRVSVPVFVDQSDTKDIKSMDLHFKYNVDANGDQLRLDNNPLILLEFLGMEPGPIFPADWTYERKLTPDLGLPENYYGHIRLAGTTELSGYGLLFYLNFKAVFGARPYHLEYFESELPWPSTAEVKELVKINDGLIQPILQPGQVVVSGDCLRPVNATDNYIIAQNRPNPFNPTTTIDYQIPQDSHIRIDVLDVLGRTVKVLVDETVAAGTHSVVFNAAGLPSGLYFYRLVAPNVTKTMKMMVSK